MTRTLATCIFVLSFFPAGAAAAACSGADPAITAVSLAGVTTSNRVNFYRVTATVTNLGTQAQAGNVLQFVDVLQYGDRLDDFGVPPLAAGQSYTISYVWKRAVEAARGSTPLNFHIRLTAPVPPGSQDCDPANNASGINI